jgi:hypothetical protein
MSKFDTHGGYFAPKDYLRVNEGGSHEENPNGGVQIGVDPEGTPNLLEEGEPVYKDYVYSDNIYADGGILEKHNLPKKYANKLYSWIADDILSEAEERPLDPTSRNGLEAMLGRAAEAQEEQKQLEQQRELEEELANLSPEELDQLETMLAQQEQIPEEQVQPEIAPEQMDMQQPVEQTPMMRCGGTLLHKFGDGGPKKNIEDDVDAILASIYEGNAYRQQYDESQKKLSQARGTLWRRRAGDYLFRGNGRQLDDAIKAQEAALMERYRALVENEGGIYTDPESPYSKSIKTSIYQIAEGLKDLREQKAQTEARIAVEEGRVRDAEKAANAAYQAYQGYKTGFLSQAPSSPSVLLNAESLVAEPVDSVQMVAPIDTSSVSAPVASASSAPVVAQKQAIPEEEGFGIDEIDFGPFIHKYGGYVNRFDDGGWQRFMDALSRYHRSERQGGIGGTYAIDTRFPLGTDYRTIEDLENSEAYRAFTDYVIKNYEDPNVQAYLKLLDAQTHGGVSKLFEGDTLRKGWEDLYRKRRTDHKGGIYHFSADVNNLGRPVAAAVSPESAVAVQNPQVTETVRNGFVPPIVNSKLTGLNSGLMYDWVRDNPTGAAYRPKPEDEPTLYPGYEMTLQGLKAKDGATPAPQKSGEDEIYSYNPYGSLLPTWPRYSGAIGSGLLGLYNVFQQPDRYVQRRLNPQLPEGRINLQNQVYNPLDQNMVANAISAQNSATNRILRNTGLGPSTAASILAADNNYTNNLGQGFIQTWDANNQRRNQVIAANNQAEAQRANFDWTVDAARKQILNDTAYKNAYNDLMLQRLNYASEADKYNAISNQINTGLQALSGIGKENFTMNQINTNPAFLGYGYGANGGIFYNPWTKQWEMRAPKKDDEKK